MLRDMCDSSEGSHVGSSDWIVGDDVRIELLNRDQLAKRLPVMGQLISGIAHAYLNNIFIHVWLTAKDFERPPLT